MTKKPRGFTRRIFPGGFIDLKMDEDGRWVILASPPDVKIDNKHRDRVPHLHPYFWFSEGERVALRPDLTAEEARTAIERHLSGRGRIAISELMQELS